MNNHYVDAHCHLSSEFFDNVDQVIKDAKENNVAVMINNADSIKSCYEVIEQSNLDDSLFMALGIHPQNCFDSFDELESLVMDNLSNKKLVAIGEIGLDYYYGKDDKEVQIEIFEKQLALAEKLDLPVIVHSREATEDTINSIKKYKVKGCIHCFSGSIETANIYLKLGFYIGVGGVLTFKNANIKDVIKQIPLDRIILETDAPFLTPEPFRKYKNEPKYVPTTAKFLADYIGEDESKVMEQTTINVRNLYHI